MILFFVGLVAGVFLGVMLTALVVAGGDRDDFDEH